MKVAIIVPAHNEVETIESVSRDVSAFGTPIVVDDGSTDGTADAAVRGRADVVRHDPRRVFTFVM